MKPTLAFALLLTFASSPRAQTSEPITMTALRALTAEAVTTGKGDVNKTMDAFDKAARAKWGEVQEGPIELVITPALRAVLIFPYGSYRAELRGALRKMESIDSIDVVPEAVIGVFPEQMMSPNIAKVVVQRGGVVAEPLRNELKPTEFKNRMGAATMINAGIVTYQLSVFAPGAAVTVTLIPESGRTNIVRKLDEKQLAKLRHMTEQ